MNTATVEILIKRTPLPGFHRAAESFPKKCGCGLSYSLETWCALPHPKSAVWPIDEHEALEMRDCPCKSTLCVQLLSGDLVREF